MDELFFNKVAAAILAVALAFMGIRALSGALVTTEVLAPSAFAYAPEVQIDNGGEVPEDLPFPQESWVAAMDASKGAKVFAKCKSCHNVDPSGKNGTGPGLYGVVGNAAGQHAGFSYSSAMAGSGITWNFEELNAYLTSPKKYVPGTKMIFNGVKKPEDRAALIEYLRVADASPSPQPTPVAAPTEEDVPTEEGSEDGTSEDGMSADGAPEDKAPAEKETDAADEAPKDKTPKEDAPITPENPPSTEQIQGKNEMETPEEAIERKKDDLKKAVEDAVDGTKNDVEEDETDDE